MRNRYEIRGDATVIFANRNGRIYEVVIDTEDLTKVIAAHDGTWTLAGKKGLLYARAQRYAGKKPVNSIYLHRLITKAPDGFLVDHINHNTLDNRKCNLRIVDKSLNGLNRAGPQANNRSSNYVNVSWNKRARKWRARFYVAGKERYLGLFSTPEEAARVVEAEKRRVLDLMKEPMRDSAHLFYAGVEGTPRRRGV